MKNKYNTYLISFFNIPDTEEIVPVCSKPKSWRFDDFSSLCDELDKLARIQSFPDKRHINHQWITPCEFETGGRKCNKDAMPTSLFFLDIDDEDNNIINLKDYLKSLSWNYYIYTSMSYTENHQKCRIILECDKNINDNEEYKKIYSYISLKLKTAGFITDDAAKTISHGFYTPATNERTGIKCKTFRWHNGNALNTDRLLFLADALACKPQTIKPTYASDTKDQTVPYFTSVADNNIMKKEAADSFIGLSDGRKHALKRLSSHIAGYCKARYGAGVVPQWMMADALKTCNQAAYCGGADMREDYDRLISDSVAHVGG